jgi:hypothetical protein
MQFVRLRCYECRQSFGDVCSISVLEIVPLLECNQRSYRGDEGHNEKEMEVHIIRLIHLMCAP